jgi:hypothetical protein
MVIRTNNRPGRRGSLLAELLIALSILVLVLIPVAYSFDKEHRLLRTYYDRAVADEIVDGEMEVLMAGEWRAFAPGSHPYAVDAAAQKNLPPGQFTVTIETNKVRLEWQPSIKGYGGPVVREGAVK